MPIKDCRIIDFPRITDSRGSLACIEANTHVPFVINRLFYLYEIPDGAIRGGHALKECQQVLIPISGHFNVVLNDGSIMRSIHLNQRNSGLYIPPLIWREMNSFSVGSICLVLASRQYDAEDYIRSYDDFISIVVQKP